MFRNYRALINMVNTSFSTPDSFIQSLECSVSSATRLILVGFSVTNILLTLPLSTYVLCLGYQRWRQQRHRSTVSASHADIFTYNSVVMELITVLGCLFYCVSAYANLPLMTMYSLEVFSSTWCIKIHFHTLTCLERYLAVVHPITYLSLKNKGGANVRNICIGCVWLTCFLWGILLDLTNSTVNMIVYVSFVIFSSSAICFCCVAVVCALRHPGPGEARGTRERVDPMKQRASNTVVSIMGVLLLCLVGMLLGDAQVSQQLSDNSCVVMASSVWFSLPSSFVLPLLYLHRAGKLPGCKHTSESS